MLKHATKNAGFCRRFFIFTGYKTVQLAASNDVGVTINGHFELRMKKILLNIRIKNNELLIGF